MYTVLKIYGINGLYIIFNRSMAVVMYLPIHAYISIKLLLDFASHPETCTLPDQFQHEYCTTFPVLLESLSCGAVVAGNPMSIPNFRVYIQRSIAE